VGEALLVAYRERGPGILETLRGDFALAIADGATGELLLAVDRFGICDLVYQHDRDTVIFGAHCDVLAAHPSAARRVSPQAIYDYAYFHAVPSPGTAFDGVKRIPAGSYALLKPGAERITAYWRIEYLEHEAPSFTELKTDLHRTLRRGVTAGLDGERCGAFLSGGTDSSTVSGFLGEVTGQPAKTFSIGFGAEGYDEIEYARIAARHFGTEHREYYVTPEDVVAAIPRIAEAYDQPFGNASAVPTYYCARLAHDAGVTRLLAGDGGDELFAGNARYVKQRVLDLYGKLPRPLRETLLQPLLLRRSPDAGPAPLRKLRSYVAQASMPMPERYHAYNLLDRLGPENVFAAEFLARVDRGHPIAMMRQTYQSARARSIVNKMLAIDLKYTLADNDLRKVTRMCELAGVDVVFPMLHDDVVALSARVPPGLKLKGTRLRYFFKEAMRGFLPDEILRKQKHGFGLPVGRWLLEHAPLRKLSQDALGSLRSRGIVRPEFIDRLLGEYMQAHAAYYGTMVWILMMLELWAESRRVTFG
jgi:asparagine synthase (glutamine-hydrolysing)